MNQIAPPKFAFRRGLSLPGGPLGVSTSTARTAREKWRTAASVEEDFRARGFSDVPQPSFECPQLTAEVLTGTDAQAYTTMFTQVTSWMSYATDNLAKIKARIRELDNLKKILAANARRDARNAAAASSVSKKPTVQEQEDALLTDPEYQDILLQLQKLEQAQDLFQARVDMLDSTWRVISRQVEIRRQELEGQHNGANGPNGRRLGR